MTRFVSYIQIVNCFLASHHISHTAQFMSLIKGNKQDMLSKMYVPIHIKVYYFFSDLNLNRKVRTNSQWLCKYAQKHVSFN
jgi:hypothetical protein